MAGELIRVRPVVRFRVNPVKASRGQRRGASDRLGQCPGLVGLWVGLSLAARADG